MPELVQPIVLLRSGCHEDAVRCAAEVSLRAYLAAPDRPEWQEWLSGIFTKTVRRAKATEYEKARVEGALAEVRHGEAAALGFAPFPAHALPRALARLQVSGTDLERSGWDRAPEDAHCVVALNESLGMSTGKAAAQAAHALWAVWLQMGGRNQERWATDNLAFRLIGVPAEEMGLERLLGIDHAVHVAIHDAGLTEVEPGSLTAVGVMV